MVIAQQIHGDGHQPAAKSVFRPVAVSRFNHAQETLLQQVLGQMWISAIAQKQIIEFLPVAPEQLLECLHVAAGIIQHQLFIAPIGHASFSCGFNDTNDKLQKK
ncbi:MAG: hypothetical protein Q9P14_05590 [candidate division KSB1 bacterium]|nr:hypothetical protein [candidate division KSB1 bacterium]